MIMEVATIQAETLVTDAYHMTKKTDISGFPVLKE